jgi:hypothetical protein
MANGSFDPGLAAQLAQLCELTYVQYLEGLEGGDGSIKPPPGFQQTASFSAPEVDLTRKSPQLAAALAPQFDVADAAARQAPELVYRLGVRAGEGAQLPVVVERESLAKALAEIADDKLAKVAPYQEYLRGRDFARRDFGKYKVWVMDGDLPPSPTRHFKRTSDGRWWLIGVVEDVEGFQIPGWRLVERNPGEVTVSRDDGPHKAAADRGQPPG